MNGQKLFFMHLWQLAKQGSTNQIAQLLSKDIDYWRMASASSNQLISKMIATVAIERNLSYGNVLLKKSFDINKQSLTNSKITIPASWERPFSHEELGMEKTFVGEWALVQLLLKNIEKRITYESGKGYVMSSELTWENIQIICCVKLNTTANNYALKLNNYLAKLNAPLDQYPKLKAELDEENYKELKKLPDLRNLSSLGLLYK